MPKPLQLTGKIFGRLTAKNIHGSSKREGVVWECSCTCGNIAFVTAKKLRNGNTKSCGCLSKDLVIKRNYRHGLAKRGEALPAEFYCWSAMIQRCTNKKCKTYDLYGGRGIEICQRWRNSFADFLCDVGKRPSLDHTIERIDVNGNYEPNNVTWATKIEQANNKRNNVKLFYNDKILTLKEAAELSPVTREAIGWRVRKGWSHKAAIETPANLIKTTKLSVM